MPIFDHDKGTASSRYDFDSMTDAEFDSLLKHFDDEDEVRELIADLAVDAEDEVRLKKMVATAVHKGFSLAKGGVTLGLLGL